MNVIITKSHKLEGKDGLLFSMHEEGKDRAGLTMGVRKAKMLLDIMENRFDEFCTVLVGYIEDNDVEQKTAVPLKEFEFNDVRYGLFEGDVVKMFAEGKVRSHWRKVTGKMASLITPETFDDQSGLNVPIAIKPVKAAKASRDTELETLKANMANMQAMMEQFLALQTAKV